MSVYSFSLFHPKCSRQYSTNLIKLMFISFFSSLLDFFFTVLHSEGSNRNETNGFACNLCGKLYSTNNSSISRHKRYHCPFSEKSPLIYCYVCSFSSRRPDNFRSHMRRMHHISDWPILIGIFLFRKKNEKKKQKRLKLVGDNWTKINIEKTHEN